MIAVTLIPNAWSDFLGRRRSYVWQRTQTYPQWKPKANNWIKIFEIHWIHIFKLIYICLHAILNTFSNISLFNFYLYSSFSCKLQKYKHGFPYFWPSAKRAKKTFLKVESAPEQSPGLAQQFIYREQRLPLCQSELCQVPCYPSSHLQFPIFFLIKKKNTRKSVRW